MKRALPLPAWIVAGTVTIGGVSYYLVREQGPTVPQPTQTHEPKPSPSHEPVCNPPGSTEKRCSSTVTCDCWTSEDDCVWTKIPPVAAPGPECDAMLTCGCWKPDGPCNWLEVPAIPDPPGPKCDADLACGCWKQEATCAPWVEVPPVGPAPGPVCNANVTCGCWEQETACSPWTKRPDCPSPPPTPQPGPCAWGKDIEGACLPPPKAVTCASLPDDPVGLLREGPGCDSKGGSGKAIITVNNAGDSPVVVPPATQPDPPPAGSLRWAYNQANGTKGRIVFDPALSGQTITLNSPLYWNKPYTTLDCSAADVTITNLKDGKDGLVITATHDVIFYRCRGKGNFKGGGPQWKQQNNSGLFTMDGDGGPFEYSWDDEWATTPAVLRRGVRDAIFDRITVSNCSDDCLATWEGTRQVSITRSLIYDSFHPSTSGAKGAPLPAGRERLDNAYFHNVWARNGERQPKLREESYRIHMANNIIAYPTEYLSFNNTPAGEKNWPVGTQLATQYPNEVNWIRVEDNCALPKAGGFHGDWGMVVENLGCETALGCCAGKPGGCTPYSGADIVCCNPKMKNAHWYFKNNQGPGPTVIEVQKSLPAGWTGLAFPWPYTPRPWTDVLAQVGNGYRTDAENALLAQISADLGKCKVPQ